LRQESKGKEYHISGKICKNAHEDARIGRRKGREAAGRCERQKKKGREAHGIAGAGRKGGNKGHSTPQSP
jgi:hypothetical protein